MQTTGTDQLEQISGLSIDALEAMVGPDPHRPGPARWRLLAEQIPIRAIIGHIGAIAGTTEPDLITPEIMAQVAEDYDVSLAAVAAALHYYRHNRGAIDGLLAANASLTA